MKLARLLAVALAPAAVAAAAPMDPPTPQALAEARTIVDSMKANPRGPFERLRWFCNDGTVHPPMPPPCGNRGGGEQHGEPSAQAQRLADLGFHVGTVYAALTWDELWSSLPRQGRLRELPLEKYMTEVDDGWVLRQARDYRGAFQIEDEEEDGRTLLLQLLAQPRIVEDEFLLVREAVRTIPHVGEGGDRTREIRRSSKDLADRDKSFETIRIRIHNDPSLSDAAATRAWVASAEAAGKDAALVQQARDLAAGIDALYGAEGRRERLKGRADKARAAGSADAWMAELLDRAASGGARARTEALCELLARIRQTCATETDPARRLALLDLSIDAEGEAVASGVEAAREAGQSRASLLSLAVSLLKGAEGAGFLSAREREQAAEPAAAMAAAAEVPAAQALAVARGLERASSWAAGTVRHAFAEPLQRYSALDPKAARFTDDLLRGSVLLPLADIASRLARDAERGAGLEHSIFGAELAGLAGLNPGVAVGELRVVTDAEVQSGARLRADQIVVLPATVSELSPVAGILTVSEGNALSHVQMLARNLGIPNAVVPPGTLESLRPQAGQRVLYAVGSGGAVVLARASDVDAALLADVTGDARKAAAANKVAAPVPDLTVRRLLPLAELDASLSGRVVGPKAANVGELAKHFPGRVAEAIAIPFGLYAQHAASGPGSPKARLDAAFAGFREGRIIQAQLEREIDAVREQVEGLSLDAPTRAALEPLAARLFGAPGTYGVFVRSDTNVEDLPQFTGAGLNKTIPHVVGFDAMLAAVPKVWASAFTQRAMAWRAQALTNPEEVYPSVLLMKSVPSQKSGVLVTADVATGGEGVTVSVAWGVGGAVDGESAETLVLRPDGGVTVVAEAKAAWRRGLAPAGGVEWLPAPAGRVLQEGEIDQLRSFVGELREKLVPATSDEGRPLPWDVEFGFVEGRLVLFQVRPLVERGAALADRVVRQASPQRPAPPGLIALSAPPSSTAVR